MNTIEKCFAAGIFAISHQLLTVLHRKKSVTKLFGGTQNGDRELWEERGEGGSFYNPHSQESVTKKIWTTLENAFSQNIVQEHYDRFNDLVQYIVSSKLSVPEIHLVIESIEEVGIIPITFELSLKQKTNVDFHQYFYVITTAYTFNKDRNRIIEITDLERDVPKNDHDFFCRDTDIDETQVLNMYDVSRGYRIDENTGEEIKINVAHKHKAALDGYIINQERKVS